MRSRSPFRAGSMLVVLAVSLMVAAAPARAQTAEPVTAQDVQVSDAAWFWRFRQLMPEAPADDPTGGWYGVARAELRRFTNPFPTDTLHVGVIAGEPIARTFLGLSTFGVTEAPSSITGGVLRLVDNQEDSVNAQAADMVACLATDVVVQDDAGDWDAQPALDCSTSAPLRLVPGSAPLAWEADLSAFADAWAGELSPGVAIVERGAGEEATPDPSRTWHVSFDASTREPESLVPRSDAIVTELERLVRVAGDVESLQRVASDPSALPTFVVVQLKPDLNALWATARVLRQTDPARGLRPPTADLILTPIAQAVSTPPDAAPAPLPPAGPIPRAPSAGIAPAPLSGTLTGALAPSAPAGPGKAVSPGARADTVGATSPAAIGGDEPLLLLLLAAVLGLGGAVGWSLSTEPELAPAARRGALSRLTARR